MMGCDANAVWSEVCRDINVGVGAPAERQIITGCPRWTVWRRPATSTSTRPWADPNRKIVLMLGSHRGPVKGPADALFQHAMNQHGGRDDVVFVHKPHPVEVSQHGSRHAGGAVTTMIRTLPPAGAPRDRRDFTRDLGRDSRARLPTPFINTIQPSDGGAPSDEVKALLSLLEGAVFTENDLDAIPDGELRPEEAACERAFARLGYRADGKNGARVLLWRDGGGRASTSRMDRRVVSDLRSTG